MTEKYFLPVGKTDFQRMSLLGSIYMPYNIQFLRTHGLRSGMNIADVGCGPGNMTLWLSEQVGPEGSVMAIDNSEEQLAILQERIRENNIHNIHTQIANIYEASHLKQQFDLIFCRFVLLHLADPLKAILELKKILVPGGKLIVCDLDNKSWLTYPPNKDLHHHYKMLEALSKKTGADLSLGPKLYGLLKKAGFESIDVEIVQPVLSSHKQREYLPMRILTCTPGFLQNNLATSVELEQLLKKMNELIENDNILIAAAQMFEVIGINGESA